MKLLKLQLENFRNHQSKLQEFQLDSNITIFLGENGLGKTNILEAIYLLSLGKSFRSKQQEDLINWGQDYYRCQAIVERDQEQSQLEVFASVRPSRRRNFRVQEINRRRSDYIGNLLTVLFHPEDLNMLYLSPSLRRQYLDIVLSQSDRHYLIALSQYNKILKQRNALLKTIRQHKFQEFNTDTLLEDLEVWDQKISESGQIIIQKRLAFVDFLNQHIQSIYQSISDQQEQVSIQYCSKIEGKYLQSLQERRQVDIIQANTTRGPHRDDLQFTINGHLINTSASRGEFRTLLLALKVAEIQFIKERTGSYPILLLDDVFSELDASRQQKLLDSIKNCQVIITSTELVSGVGANAHIITL